MEGHFGTLGYLVVGIFGATWIVTILIYRMMGYRKIPTPTI
jgi:high-affinity nickel permease